ncbi:biopolymer transporter ExbD [Fibrisoma limi]|nr:biopolymer transporter ExbD [Fibrisoma limi]
MRAIRQTHRIPRVDLTPFVSIAMILITFFIWMKQVQRSSVVSLYMANNAKFESYQPLSACLYLLEQDKIGYLTYVADDMASYVETTYSANGLRARLLTMASAKDPVVLIKPTAQSTIKNLVDVVDELAINKRIKFELVNRLAKEEQQMILAYKNYIKSSSRQPIPLNVRLYRRGQYVVHCQYTSVRATK